MAEPCRICGAQERLVSKPRPVRDSLGNLIYIGWDEEKQVPLPQMEAGPVRIVIEHDPVKHGLHKYA